MIKGVGIDIIEIKRVEDAIKRNPKFLGRIYTLEEINYFKKIKYRKNTIAGNFAAKEAVMKVLGTGLRQFKWTDIEVRRDDLGKPFIYLYGNAEEIAKNLGIQNIMLSISHSREYAVAQAIGISD